MESEKSDANSTVKLISSEGQAFLINKDAARVSGTIRAMLDSQFAEKNGEIVLNEISSAVLEKVVEYLNYKLKYSSTSSQIPPFEIPPEIVLELLMASNYLDC